jgi:hypothetical protein
MRRSLVPLLVSLAITLPVSLSAASESPADATQSVTQAAARAHPDPYVIAAGDIACGDPALDYEPDHDPFVRTQKYCHEDVTAAMFAPGGRLAGPGLRAVLPLGDLQYEFGGARDGFRNEYTYENPKCSIVPGFEAGPCSFHESWAKAASVWSEYGLKPIPIRPTPGNHEYQEEEGNCALTGVEGNGDPFNACGYNDYWGDRVAVPARAQNGDGGGSYYFRFDVKKPHPILFVSLNTGPCAEVNGLCARGSELIRFLQRVLASRELNPPESCTVVYYHHPAWDWFLHGDLDYVLPVWRTMLDPDINRSQRPDLVLNGHNHLYERYEPLDANGDVATGLPAIPQITVGTGGKNAGYIPSDPPKPHTGPPAAWDIRNFGVEKVSWSPETGRIEAALYREGAAKPFDPVSYRCNGASL